MKVGEKIFSSNSKQTYTVLQCFKAGGQSEVCFASSDKSNTIFFVKRFLNIKYTEKSDIKDKCLYFENYRSRLYDSINKNTLPGASCSYVFDFFREKSFYYVVTEKIDGLELPCKKLSETLPIEERLFLFKMIVYAFLPFEKNDIIHGDIKPENIFLEFTNLYPVVRIIDFESAFFSKEPPQRGYIVGTEPYYSPELAAYNSESSMGLDVELSTKSDIFSLGLILYELLTGAYPKSSNNEYWYEASLAGRKVDLRNEWSKDLRDLLNSMLDIQPSKRPSIEEILSSLRNINDVSVPDEELACPIIKIHREDSDKASVYLYNFCKNTRLEYSINGSEFCLFTHKFYIEDDDVELSMKLISSAGISKLYHDIISVSGVRHKKCKRPQIKVNAGKVYIFHESEKAKLYFTIDGSTPSTRSQQYVEPFFVDENTVIKATAGIVGYRMSDPAVLNSSSKIKIS